MAVQCDAVFRTFQTSQTRLAAELKWIGGDARQMQIEFSRLQLLVHGFTSDVPADTRAHWLFEHLTKVPDIQTEVRWRLRFRDDAELRAEDLYCLLQGEPITVQYSNQSYSTITVLTFNDFRMRKATATHFQSADLKFKTESGKQLKIAIKPAAPRFQRKLEGVLRALLECISKHPDYEGQTCTILWPTLTIMAPQTEMHYDPNHQAWATVKYEEELVAGSGTIKVGCYVHQDLADVMHYVPLKVEKPDENLWYTAWYNQFWRTGVQNVQDDVEDAAATRAPKMGKRWIDTMLQGSSTRDGFPLPISITKMAPHEIGYSQVDYDYKMARAGFPKPDDPNTQRIQEVGGGSAASAAAGGGYTKEQWEEWNAKQGTPKSHPVVSPSQPGLTGGTSSGAAGAPQTPSPVFSKAAPPYTSARSSPSPSRSTPY
jgi:hypothetical protein